MCLNKTLAPTSCLESHHNSVPAIALANIKHFVYSRDQGIEDELFNVRYSNTDGDAWAQRTHVFSVDYLFDQRVILVTLFVKQRKLLTLQALQAQ